jgi:hypothetical protein
MKKRNWIVCSAAAFMLAVVGGTFAADEWPTRQPIKLVVPFDAGAGTDTVYRFYAQQLSKALGQQVIVENVGGAGGAIGTMKVARASADGYTLLGTMVTGIAALPHLQKLQYDGLKDLTPIARVAYPISLLGVNKELGINTLPELIALAKKEPGKFAYGSAGIGSAPALRFEVLQAETGIQLEHVPYKGGTAYVTDLLSGRIQIFVDSILGSQLGKADKVKLLAVMDDKRVADFPNVPTINEILPGFKNPPTWYLMEGPANLPPAIAKRIATELANISRSPEAAEFLAKQMTRPSTDQSNFNVAAELQSAYDLYAKMLRDRVVKP